MVYLVTAAEIDALKFCTIFDQQQHPELNAVSPISAKIFFLPERRCGTFCLGKLALILRVIKFNVLLQ